MLRSVKQSRLDEPPISPPAWSRVEDRQAWSDFWSVALTSVLNELSDGVTAEDGLDAPATALDPRRLVRQWLGEVGIASTMGGDWSAYEALLRRIGSECARHGTSLVAWYELMAALKRRAIAAFTREHSGAPERLAQAITVMEELADRSLQRIGGTYVLVSQQALAEQKALAEQRAEELRISERSLREQTTILEAVLNSMRDGLWVCDNEGRHLMMNSAAQAMFGSRKVGDLIVGSVDTIYEEDGTSRIAAADLALARAIRGFATDDVRAIARNPGREPIMLLMHGRPLHDASGRPFGGLSVIRDVTAVERLSQRSAELEQENERARAADRMKSQILANISHELRTPLNAVIGFAELMHEGHAGITSPQQQEFLGDILSSGRHLLQMINDLLDLAKIEADKMSFRPEVFNLPVLIEEACSVVRVAAAKKRIRLVIAVNEAIGPVTLDPARTKQILYNYLSNAVKFTGEEGRVIVHAEPEGEYDFRIEVEDTGIGIALADQGRLFAPFQQLDPSITQCCGGTGLGLALTRRIVEAQGGSVGVRSTLGVGSVFHAILPRQTTSTSSGSLLVTPRRMEEIA